MVSWNTWRVRLDQAQKNFWQLLMQRNSWEKASTLLLVCSYYFFTAIACSVFLYLIFLFRVTLLHIEPHCPKRAFPDNLCRFCKHNAFAIAKATVKERWSELGALTSNINQGNNSVDLVHSWSVSFSGNGHFILYARCLILHKTSERIHLDQETEELYKLRCSGLWFVTCLRPSVGHESIVTWPLSCWIAYK